VSAVEEQSVEQRSSVEVSRNAKGDAQLRVKLYDGVAEAEVDRLRGLATDTYRALEREFYGAPKEA
jgi:hypothetical protein